MLITKGSREDAIHALINVWLKDPQKHCGSCGQEYVPAQYCCDNPYIATNSEILRQFTLELNERREAQRNKYASNTTKTMRIVVSMPASLLLFLEKVFEKQYKEKLFTKEYPPSWFAKKFYKYFSVPEVV